MIAVYLDIVRSNIADGVPKAIMLQMVNRLKGTVYENLVKGVYGMTEAEVEMMLAESPAVQERRDKCKKMIKALREAEAAVAEVYNFQLQ